MFPILSKASLEGAKIVTSLRESTGATREVVVRAPARDNRFESIADMDGEMGMVRTVSTMCITPPLNIIS